MHINWSWNSSTLATWCEDLTHLKRPWCWERLRAGGEGDDRGWDGWMASPTQWTWGWVGSGSWSWTGRPGVLRFMGSQSGGYDWATELNWMNACVWNLETWNIWSIGKAEMVIRRERTHVWTSVEVSTGRTSEKIGID